MTKVQAYALKKAIIDYQEWVQEESDDSPPWIRYGKNTPIHEQTVHHLQEMGLVITVTTPRGYNLYRLKVFL